jgi:AcrR family transcriptional regulator
MHLERSAAVNLAKVRLSREKRRRQILEATYQCILRQGLGGTRVRHIAKAAGVNQATIFSHFPSMKALYASLLDRLLEDYLNLTKNSLDGAPPVARIKVIIELGKEFATSRSEMNRVYYDFWVQSIRDSFLKKKMIESYNAYRSNIKKALTSRIRTKTKGEETSILAAFVVGILEGGAVQLILDPKAFDSQKYFALAEQVIEALVSHTYRPSARAKRRMQFHASPDTSMFTHL